MASSATSATSVESTEPAAEPRLDTRVLIVGCGFAGLGMAVRLHQEGMTDFLVLERADEVGGTWRDNTYPGCACDVPSLLYSFDFALNPRWSNSFSPQPEIQEYLRRCARESGVLSRVRFSTAVTGARWDETDRCWVVDTSRGQLRSRVFVSATGALSEPLIPDLPGLDRFDGTTFHSATWNHDYDLTGKRVAVVGSGASAIQFVPQIQPKVAALHLFQRTPPWIMPRPSRHLSRLEQRLYERLPVAERAVRAGIYWGRETFVLGFSYQPRLMRVAERVARWHLKRQVPDPALRAKLTPDYEIGCKRILISNDYYPSLTKPNVEVVTDGLADVREHSVVDRSGRERPVDAIIFGTGFHVTDLPAAAYLRGRGGKLLADAWQGSPQAHLGTTVTGFPNLFLLVGPNTGLGHTSQVFMIQSQIEYVLDALRRMRRDRLAVVEPRPDVQAHYNDALQRRMGRTVWTTGGCASWYLDANGRNTTLWPGFTWHYRMLTRRFRPEQYVIEREDQPPAPQRPDHPRPDVIRLPEPVGV